MIPVAVLVISIAFGALRFVLPVSGEINRADIYKDFAHLWVGGIIGAAVALGEMYPYGWIAVGLTTLEVVAFIARKKK